MDVIVHGGAGGAPERPDRRQSVLEKAAEAGTGADDPLSAVESAVRALESNARFNAGRGSAVQSDGRIRTDAGVMTGDGSIGAACSMQGVEHAVSAARVVLEETPHILVSGANAVALADEFGVETDVDLWTDRTRERWETTEKPYKNMPRSHLEWVDRMFGESEAGDEEGGDPSDHDTVGAVAHEDGEFAAATSTGGRWYAFAGRVGDVPQVGAGFFCSGSGGASATGAGEEIARVNMARTAVHHLDQGHSARMATRLAMDEFEKYAAEDASAGLIVLGRGGAHSAYNSEAMQTAVASD